MKKLFLFIAATLVSTGMWAASKVVTWCPTSDDVTELLKTSPAGEVTVGTGTTSFKVYAWRPFIDENAVKIEWNSTEKAIKTTDNSAYKAGLVVYIPTGSKTVEKIEVYIHQSSSGTRKTYYGGPFVGTNPTSSATATGSTVAKSSTAYEFWNTYTANTYYAFGGKKDGSGDVYYDSIKVTFDNCTDPEATIIENTAGYVGVPIDLEFESLNTSTSAVYDIKKGGAATGDASITDGVFTATATGTYVVTVTQAKNATYCAVEESVTLTIANAAEVESVSIDGAASRNARLNEEVALTVTAANATQYKWLLKKDAGEYSQVATTAGYTFSVTEVGTYSIKCEARNDFNAENEWIASDPVTITVTKSADATLSALSVAGKTMSPTFDAAETTYSVSGQLGVYELLSVSATATDAPYATVAIVDNKTNTVTVTVTAEAENTQAYTIGYTRKAATELAQISASTTWDWANAGSATAEQKATGTFPSNAEEFNFADVLISPAESFNAAALSGIAQFAKRGDSYNCFQGTKVKFNTTAAGSVQIYYQNTSNRSEDGRRWVDINGTKKGEGAIDQKDWYLAEGNVSAGDVVITFEDKDAAATMLRINKIVFTKGGTVGIENTETNVNAIKRVVNGQLFIEKNGKVYNAMGQEIR